MKIAVVRERAPGETRVSATPETVKKFVALGASVAVESGAGEAAAIADADYAAAGAEVSAAAVAGADIVLGVQGPDPAALASAAPGAWVVAGLDPFGERGRVDGYAAAGLEALAMEFMPRITRAQSMDILSSQSNLSGYKAVIEAANLYGRAFPMMMTAAGTISAAKAFVMGVGVAGLQALATARRRGAPAHAPRPPTPKSTWNDCPAGLSAARPDSPPAPRTPRPRSAASTRPGHTPGPGRWRRLRRRRRHGGRRARAGRVAW